MTTFAFSGRTRAGQSISGERAADTMEAAVAGLGVALAREPLCAPEIESGDVVPLAFAPLPIDSGYWLTFPAGAEPRRDVMAFLRWLCAEVGRSDELRASQ